MTLQQIVPAQPHLADAVAIVTGAGGGLGEQIALTMANAGASVIVADVRDGAASQVADRIAKSGYDATPLTLDVSEADACAAAIDGVVEARGRIDIVVNNAGVDVTAPLDEISVDDWDRICAVNLRAPYVLSRTAFRHMRAARAGSIVNIVSTAAKRAWPNAAAYHASKWGLLGLSHAMHAEGRAAGIKVTAVIAGGMRTPFLFDRFPDLDPGLLQDPANVAATVLWALSQPIETVIPEVMVLPMGETSWP